MMTWKIFAFVTAMYAAGNLAVADTVAWWRFGDKGTSGGKMAVGEVFTNAVNPELYAARACSFQDLNGPGTDEAYMPSCTNAFADWSRLQVYDPVTQKAQPMAGALHCPWGGNGSGLSGGAVVPADPALWGVKEGVQGDFTFECFFRTTAEGLARSTLMEPIAGMPNPGGTWGAWSLIIYNKRLWIRGSGYKTDGTVGYANSGSDGKLVTPDVWHHAALVYTKADQTFRLYLDYVFQVHLPLKTSDGYTGDIAAKTAEKGGYLYFAKATYNNDRSLDGTIAEARLSDTALATSDFLHLRETAFVGDRVSSDPDTLYWGSMDSEASFSSGISFFSSAAFSASEQMLSSVRCVPPEGASTLQLATEPVVNAQVCTWDEGQRRRVANAGALAFATNNADLASTGTNAGRSFDKKTGYVEFADPARELAATNFTQEMFFKVYHPVVKTTANNPAWSYCLMNSPSFKVIVYSSGKGALFCRLKDADGVTVKSYTDVRSVDDGAWHHLAIVYDRGAKTFDLWLDYVLRQRTAGIELANGSTAAAVPWTIGATAESSGTNFQAFDGWIDEVRLTRRALTSEEFLMPSGECDSRTLAWAHFDGNLQLLPYTFLTGTNKLSCANYSAGVLPTTDGEPRKTRLSDGVGNLLLTNNTASLEMSGGSVEFLAPSAIVRRDLTIEFFMKPVEWFSAWAGPLGLFRSRVGSLPEWNYTHCWNFGGQGTWEYSRLQFSVATVTNGVVAVHQQNFGPSWMAEGTRTGNAMTWPANFDNHWHHVAASLMTTAEENTRIRLYYDYQKVAEYTRPGLLNIQPGEKHYLIAGITPYGHRPYRGFLDEVRISAGELSVEDFLRVPPQGTLIMFR